MPLSLDDPKTKKYLMYGVPIALVVAYALYRRSKTAPTSATAPIGSSGALGAGQLSALQEGYNNGFNTLQAEIAALGARSNPSSSGAPTGQVSNPVPATVSAAAPGSQPPPAQQAPAALPPASWQVANSLSPTPTPASPIVMQGQIIGETYVSPGLAPSGTMNGVTTVNGVVIPTSSGGISGSDPATIAALVQAGVLPPGTTYL